MRHNPARVAPPGECSPSTPHPPVRACGGGCDLVRRGPPQPRWGWGRRGPDTQVSFHVHEPKRRLISGVGA